MQNKKSLIIIFLPILLILIFVIIKSTNKNSFSLDARQTLELSQNQNHILSFIKLKEKLQSDKKIVLVDLRTAAECGTGKLKNAINIPLSEILNNEQLIDLKSTDNEIVLYSNSLIETTKAWTVLSQMGYHLYILDIPGNVISNTIFEKDTIIESNEVLKYKFQPDTQARLE